MINTFCANLTDRTLPLFDMLAIEYIEIEFNSIFIKILGLKHRDEVVPFWMYDRVVDNIFENDIVEPIEILDELLH